jgi:hypothetical protein
MARSSPNSQLLDLGPRLDSLTHKTQLSRARRRRTRVAALEEGHLRQGLRRPRG